MAQYTISSCNDGGWYYITEYIAVGEDRTIAWVGADDDGRFCNVMWGRYPRRNQLFERFQGEWWDVPLGSATGNGTIEIEVGTFGASRVEATGGFGGSSWEQLQRRPEPAIDHALPLRTGRREGNGLTGYWRSANTLGHYYIRELGNTVVWFAAREDRSAANVFKGVRERDLLTGEWIDVPLGRTRGRGRVSFRVFSEGGVYFTMRQISASSGYGARTISRVE